MRPYGWAGSVGDSMRNTEHGKAGGVATVPVVCRLLTSVDDEAGEGQLVWLHENARQCQRVGAIE